VSDVDAGGGRVAATDGLELKKVTRSFGIDVLIAASCREAGVIVVTRNGRDCERIARVLPFEYTDAWPIASGSVAE
jgi:predicted nucleic acid-binding protein